MFRLGVAQGSCMSVPNPFSFSSRSFEQPDDNDCQLAWQLQAKEYSKACGSLFGGSSQALSSQLSFKNLSFSIKKVPGDGDCFFHAVNRNELNRDTLIKKLLGHVDNEATRAVFAHDIRQFLYLGYTGSHPNEKEGEACKKMLTEDVKKLFDELVQFEKALDSEIRKARSELGEPSTHGKTAKELLTLLLAKNSSSREGFEKAYNSVLVVNEAILKYCSDVKIFEHYIRLYLEEAKGYITFSRELGSDGLLNDELPKTTIDVINQLFELNIQVYLLSAGSKTELQLVNQKWQGKEIPIFYNGINHFDGLSSSELVGSSLPSSRRSIGWDLYLMLNKPTIDTKIPAGIQDNTVVLYPVEDSSSSAASIEKQRYEVFFIEQKRWVVEKSEKDDKQSMKETTVMLSNLRKKEGILEKTAADTKVIQEAILEAGLIRSPEIFNARWDRTKELTFGDGRDTNRWKRRLDSIARLIENGSTCAAIMLENDSFLIATNKNFIQNSEDQGALLIDQVMSFFKKIHEKGDSDIDSYSGFKEAFRSICRGAMSGLKLSAYMRDELVKDEFIERVLQSKTGQDFRALRDQISEQIEYGHYPADQGAAFVVCSALLTDFTKVIDFIRKKRVEDDPQTHKFITAVKNYQKSNIVDRVQLRGKAVDLENMHAEMRMLTHIKDRLEGSKLKKYELCLMDDLPKVQKPETGKVYLKKVNDNQLEYIVHSTNNKEGKETGSLNFPTKGNLNLSDLNREKSTQY